MIRLRLKRYGRKGQPCYRIVATDRRNKRDGRTMEELGYYDPVKKKTYLNFDRITERLKQGAQPTATVLALLKKDLYIRQYERKVIE